MSNPIVQRCPSFIVFLALNSKFLLHEVPLLFLAQLDWEEFVTVIVENTTNITVNASEPVIVRTPTYFTNLTDIFAAANER